MEIWVQHYDPTGNIFVSALIAAIPAILLLILIAALNVRIHVATLISLAACLAVALGVYHMPFSKAAASALYGGAFGLIPVGWMILNIIFIYQLTLKRGLFDVLRDSLARIAPDPRIQLVLIAYALGSFLEGVAGFGAPVAICAAILIQLGFRPLHASGLSLVANTAPVAFGGLGIPLTTLEQVTDIHVRALSATVGAALAPFSTVIPFFIIYLFAGWRGLRGVWPAAATAGLAYTIPQYLISTYHGPWLTAPVSAICSIAAVVILLRFWGPKEPWSLNEHGQPGPAAAPYIHIPTTAEERRKVREAWMPWAILTGMILLWGIPQFQNLLDRIWLAKISVPHLDHLIQRMPPVVPAGAVPESAVFRLNLLSTTGTGIFAAAIPIGFLIEFSGAELVKIYFATVWKIRYSLLAIVAMLALGNVTRYSGCDGTMGLALAHTAAFYPFFGTLLGWIGAGITGSDTSSNVLFGSLQQITARQIGISPVLMCSANTCGGVMGKMISSQSIVVASTATNWYGHEGSILRYVFIPSVGLAALMGLLVFLEAYVAPFTWMVAK